ncbi:MAG TPA: 30S ribosome-binding factor RbfA [Woeseiaceae bacterium]|nr:30S ribosome-binding factor RbfA [Woeseiaceae bacterium]
MPREFSRHQRLAAQIQRILSDLLRFEVKDPGVARVSITSVDLSKDLSVARVYFNLLDPEADPAPAEEGLRRAAGFLRSRLGGALDVRHVPELRFVHDDSIARGFEISRLIDSAKPGGDGE